MRPARIRPSSDSKETVISPSEVRQHGDLVITVCDLAHEELAEAAAVHSSIPDPVSARDPGSFDSALAELAGRVARFAPRLAAVS